MVALTNGVVGFLVEFIGHALTELFEFFTAKTPVNSSPLAASNRQGWHAA